MSNNNLNNLANNLEKLHISNTKKKSSNVNDLTNMLKKSNLGNDTNSPEPAQNNSNLNNLANRLKDTKLESSTNSSEPAQNNSNLNNLANKLGSTTLVDEPVQEFKPVRRRTSKKNGYYLNVTVKKKPQKKGVKSWVSKLAESRKRQNAKLKAARAAKAKATRIRKAAEELEKQKALIMPGRTRAQTRVQSRVQTRAQSKKSVKSKKKSVKKSKFTQSRKKKTKSTAAR